MDDDFQFKSKSSFFYTSADADSHRGFGSLGGDVSPSASHSKKDKKRDKKSRRAERAEEEELEKVKSMYSYNILYMQLDCFVP